MRRIRINVYEPKIVIVIEERNKENIFMTNNIFAKREAKRWKSDVDVNNDLIYSKGYILFIRLICSKYII